MASTNIQRQPVKPDQLTGCILGYAGCAECRAPSLCAEPVPGGVAPAAPKFVLLAALAVRVEVPEWILFAATRALDGFSADRDI